MVDKLLKTITVYHMIQSQIHSSDITCVSMTVTVQLVNAGSNENIKDPHNWPFVRGIHRWPMVSIAKRQSWGSVSLPWRHHVTTTHHCHKHNQHMAYCHNHHFLPYIIINFQPIAKLNREMCFISGTFCIHAVRILFFKSGSTSDTSFYTSNRRYPTEKNRRRRHA